MSPKDQKVERRNMGTRERPPVPETGYPRRPGKVEREGGAPIVVGAWESRAHGEGGQGVGQHSKPEQRSVDSDHQASAWLLNGWAVGGLPTPSAFTARP